MGNVKAIGARLSEITKGPACLRTVERMCINCFRAERAAAKGAHRSGSADNRHGYAGQIFHSTNYLGDDEHWALSTVTIACSR